MFLFCFLSHFFVRDMNESEIRGIFWDYYYFVNGCSRDHVNVSQITLLFLFCYFVRLKFDSIGSHDPEESGIETKNKQTQQDLFIQTKRLSPPTIITRTTLLLVICSFFILSYIFFCIKYFFN